MANMHVNNGYDPELAAEKIQQCLYDTANEKSRRRNLVFKNRANNKLSDADYEDKRHYRSILDEARIEKNLAREALSVAAADKQALRDAYQKVSIVSKVPSEKRNADHAKMLDEAEAYISRAAVIRTDYDEANSTFIDAHEAEVRAEKRVDAENKRLSEKAEKKAVITSLGDDRLVLTLFYVKLIYLSDLLVSRRS